MADAVFDQLTALEKRRDAVLEALKPEAADASIAADLATFDTEATRDGVYIADAAARGRYEDGRRQLYDDARRAEVEALERDHAALLQTIAEATAAFQRPPVEDNLGLATMRELTALTRWQGRTLAEVVRAYQRTTDADNPTFVDLVENDREALRLRPDRATDVQAVQDLQRAIAEHQAARVPEGFRGALPRAQAVLAGDVMKARLALGKTRGAGEAADAVESGGAVTFAEFMRELVRVRDERTGELRAPVLHPAEVQVVAAMDARDPATGLRQFLTVVISWPRKAGKSFVSGCIAVYMLVFDRHATQREVLVQASTKDQGRSAVFLAAKRLVKANPWLATRITILQDSMTYVDEAGVEHTMRVLPNDPSSIHGLNASCTVYDEGWIHVHWESLEGTSPSPARQCPLTVWASYSGLKSQRHPGNPWFDTLTTAQRGDDATVFLSHLTGREAALSVPWITPAWLARLERQFTHIRSKYLRLGLNIWSTSDSGAFLTEEEIADALDRTLPAMVTTKTPRPTARIGIDLGLVKDRTAIVALDLAVDGRLVVLHVEMIQGTRLHPVSLLDVEARIIRLAGCLGTKHVVLDRWQSAQMSEGLRRRGLWVELVTCDASWLDRAAMHLKHWFSQRHIKIPPHPGLLEELEGLEAEELRRRDRIRFTATGSNHDDGCVALCLAAERFAGKLRPEDSQIGRPKLAEIDRCVAHDLMGGQYHIDCPVANEGPSLRAGCRRCDMYKSVEPLYYAHLASGAEWVPLGVFVQARLQPNRWLVSRRCEANLMALGL